MPASKKHAATAPARQTGDRVKAAARSIVTGFYDNLFAFALIADAAFGSFHHEEVLAETQGGQTGIGIQVAAGIFDLAAIAFKMELQKNQKLGLIRQNAFVSLPALCMLVAIGMTVAANWATASPGFWGHAFATAAAISLGLIIYIRDRRAAALAALAAAGTGTGEPATGTGTGTQPGTGGTGTGTGAGTGTGTGGGAAQPAAGNPPPAAPAVSAAGGKVALQPGETITDDGKIIPGGHSVAGLTDDHAVRAAMRNAAAAFALRNGGATARASDIALMIHKRKVWVLPHWGAITAEDAARAAGDGAQGAALAVVADTAGNEEAA